MQPAAGARAPGAAEQALRPPQQHDREDREDDDGAKARTVRACWPASAPSPRISAATRPPATLPMPPMTMTISALSVYSAPIVGFTVRNEDSRMPATAAKRGAGGEGQRAVLAQVDAHQRRRVRARRDGAHGAAGRGVAQEREHGGRQHEGGDHHDQAVVLDHGAEHVDGLADEVAVAPGRCRSRPPARCPAAGTAGRRWRGWSRPRACPDRRCAQGADATRSGTAASLRPKAAGTPASAVTSGGNPSSEKPKNAA